MVTLEWYEVRISDKIGESIRQFAEDSPPHVSGDVGRLV